MPKINEKCLDLIKKHTGCVLHASKDDVGNNIIGHGHKILPGERFEGTIKPSYADELLLWDAQKYAGVVDALVTVPLNDNQYGALVSFVFHLGAHRRAAELILFLTPAEGE